MQSFTLISLIVNFGFIILCLSLLYPKAIQRYKKAKKQRETHRVKEIQTIVHDYLEQLKND